MAYNRAALMSRQTAIRLGAAVLVAAAAMAADAQAPRPHLVPLLAAADDDQRQGFVRVVNRSETAGDVSVLAIDDAGARHGPVTLAIGGRATVHFNSGDLERGNVDKGLSGGVGDGEGDWHLEVSSALDIEVLAYMRTASGFLTTMHEAATPVREGHVVPTFNPASNPHQASRLRVINRGAVEAEVRIAGRDDRGRDDHGPGVTARLAAGAAHTFTARELESGEGWDGSLGVGHGKWRLVVTADQPIVVTNLLASEATGVMTNLSSRPGGTEGFPQPGEGVPEAFIRSAPAARLPLFTAPQQHRQSFARVVNHSDHERMVRVEAIDDAGQRRVSTLTLGPRQTASFNSDDLENGNADKGLPNGIGDGTGDWRLRLAYDPTHGPVWAETEQPPEALAYMRTADGLLTSLHDVVENRPDRHGRSRHVVPTFNPASNGRQASLLRVTNTGPDAALVTIVGIDDAATTSEVAASIPAGASRTLTAAELESGDGLAGALGDGAGKWRLEIVADQPIVVMNLLENRATGHLTNLSSRPPRAARIADESLRAAVEDALGAPRGDAIASDQMRMLGCLWVGRHVADLTGVEAATALTLFGLGAYRNDVVDLSPLTGLTALVVLELGANRIADIAPLAGLRALKRLHLRYNGIADISPLVGLTALRRLHLGGNRIADISPLATLTGLVELRIDDNVVSDIAPLAGLTMLEHLRLNGNAAADLSPLSALTRLTRLHAGYNGLSDIAPLAPLGALVELDLTGNAIRDLEPLAALTALQTLRLGDNRVVDISALSGLTNLVELNLRGNDISDIAALAGLTALRELHLSYNHVVDLAPLVDLAAAALAVAAVDYNPLGDAARETQIPALRQGGVDVLVHEPFPDDDDFPDSRLIRIHNDNVAVMHATTDLTEGYEQMAYAQDFLKWFSDSFDFIVFYSNLDDADAAALATGYYGVYSPVSNDTLGLGPYGAFYDDRYGSAGRLKGVIHIPYNDHGPLAHELLHAWSQSVVPSAAGGHWGFSSAGGVHGGFERDALVELGEDRYSAGDFGGWGGGGGYSPIEMYLAGYVAPQEVPPLWVAADGQWLEEDGVPVYDQLSNPVFTATDVREYAIEDIIAAHGPRAPSHADAQWHFRVAAILLTNADHPATDAQLERLSASLSRFSHDGDDGDANYDNFHEVTNGRGSVTMDGLAELRKTSPGLGALPPAFGTAPPPAFCRPRPDGKGWTHDRAHRRQMR